MVSVCLGRLVIHRDDSRTCTVCKAEEPELERHEKLTTCPGCPGATRSATVRGRCDGRGHFVEIGS